MILARRGGRSQPTVAGGRIDPALLKLGLAVVLGVIMSLLDTTIVNVAIDTLSRSFHAPISTVQWVTTGYLLALAVVLPLSGWASDRFGDKRLFLGSIVIFTLGSVACGLAPSIGTLIAFRILQGAGGAFIMPIAQAVVARAAGPVRMGRMMSVIGIPAMLAPVLGPALGGVIIDNLSWRWVFFVNLPIGIAAVACCARVLPADRPQPTKHLDRLGLALLCPGLAAVVYGLSNAGTTGSFTAPSVLGWLLGGLALAPSSPSTPCASQSTPWSRSATCPTGPSPQAAWRPSWSAPRCTVR